MLARQNLDFGLDLADRVHILDKGSVIVVDTGMDVDALSPAPGPALANLMETH